MRRKILSIITCVVLQSGVAMAETVVEAVPDKTPGRVFGGLSGLMIGAAGSGPIALGIVAGTAVGWFAGGEIQAQTGLSGTAYRVEANDGKTAIIRSPDKQWLHGDKVDIVSGRLVAAKRAIE